MPERRVCEVDYQHQEAEIGAERRAYSQIVIVFSALPSLPEIFSASLLFCFLYLFFCLHNVLLQNLDAIALEELLPA